MVQLFYTVYNDNKQKTTTDKSNSTDKPKNLVNVLVTHPLGIEFGSIHSSIRLALLITANSKHLEVKGHLQLRKPPSGIRSSGAQSSFTVAKSKQNPASFSALCRASLTNGILNYHVHSIFSFVFM